MTHKTRLYFDDRNQNWFIYMTRCIILMFLKPKVIWFCKTSAIWLWCLICRYLSIYLSLVYYPTQRTKKYPQGIYNVISMTITKVLIITVSEEESDISCLPTTLKVLCLHAIYFFMLFMFPNWDIIYIKKKGLSLKTQVLNKPFDEFWQMIYPCNS